MHQKGKKKFRYQRLCRNKMKKLQTKYYEASDRNKKSGSGRNSFPFYDQMAPFMKDKPSVNPGRLLASSTGRLAGKFSQ
nr:hypothetical protein BaRGS_025849 [Batillaria attramentaria]